MIRSFRSALAFIVLSAAALTANAQTYSAMVSYQSDPGDYLGQGGSATYTENVKAIGNSYNNAVSISWSGIGDTGYYEWLHVTMAAPGGEQLKPGIYDGATRYPFNTSGTPGLDVSTTGRGCNTSTGKFVIDEVKYGPNGYVETLVGSYENRCDYSTGAIRGTFAIYNPPAPPALAIEMTIDNKGYVDKGTGYATVKGLVACTSPTNVWVSGTIVQPSSRFSLNQAFFYTNVNCGMEPVEFMATVAPYGNGTKFEQGAVKIDAQASAYDTQNWNMVTSRDSEVGHLVPVKKLP